MDRVGRHVCILLVGAQTEFEDLLREAVVHLGWEADIHGVCSLSEIEGSLEKKNPDLVIAEARLPDGHMTDFLALQTHGFPYALIVLDEGTEEFAPMMALPEIAVDTVQKGTLNANSLSYLLLQTLAKWQHLSEYRRALHALRESEDRYRRLYEGVPIGLYQTTPDGTILTANPAAARIFGYDTPEELMGKTVTELYGDSDSRHRLLQLLNADGYLVSEATNCRRRDGTIFVGSLTARTIYDDEGCVLRYDGVIEDITEKKQAELDLRRSEERYRAISHLISDYAYAFQVQEDGSIVPEWVTGAFTRITGYTQEELQAQGGWETLILPEDLHLAYDQLKSLMAGKPHTVEYRVRTKDDEIRWMLDHARPVQDENLGRIVSIYGAVQDVTENHNAEKERRQLESQLQYAQKLESLGLLAGGIAHDFNNLLVGILGNADLSLKQLPASSSLGPRLEQIVGAARQAADLCQQMLSYAGRAELVAKTIDLAELVHDVILLLSASISKKISIRYEAAPQISLIHADPAQVTQVIMNLVINAAEAIGDGGGVVSVHTGSLWCDRGFLIEAHLGDELAPGDYIYLEVDDTGCGLDQITMHRLFDPFFSTKFMGRGMGLAAVLGIVRRHGGAIRVKSELGFGTTFTVLFPLARDIPDTASYPASLEADWRGSGTVLVVDDEEIVRSVVSIMLEELGFSVIKAVSGSEALEIYRNDPSSLTLVLLDMNMPDMSGEEVFDAMREIRGNTKILLTSGFSEYETLELFRGKGMAGFVQKPYDIATLRMKLAEVLGTN